MKTIVDLASLIAICFRKKTAVKKETLAANATTVTFTQMPTDNHDYAVEFYAEDGSAYTALDISTPGTAILTYEAAASARKIFCIIEEV